MNAVWNGCYALMLTVWLMVLAPMLPAQTPQQDSARARAVKAQTDSLRTVTQRLTTRIDSIERANIGTTPPPIVVPPDTTTPPPVVVPPDTARFSGPAELPRVYLNFPYPAPVRTVTVAAGGLQAALNAAQRGDELVVSGTHTGNFTVSSCGPGWITVRSAAAAPPIGTRVKPLTAAAFAKLVTNNNLPTLKVAAGACRWRFVGLEVALSQTFTVEQYGLVHLEGTDVVLDRVYGHGNMNSQLIRVATMNGARQEISGSWFDECHAKGYDAQAIWGGDGTGPFRIANNTLMCAGENIMFGGSVPKAGLVPSDIEIRGNHLAKPLAWYAAGWTIKNLLELKNAARVLIEGNILEGLQRDNGGSVIFKSANQAQVGASPQCTWCRSTDVTFRHNHIRNVGSGIAVSGKGDNPNTDTTARRIDIRENVLDVTQPNGNRRGAIQLGAVQQVSWTRNVFAGTGDAASILEAGGSRCTFDSNVWARGQYGVFASGAGSGTPALTKGCGATGYTWTAMTFVGASNGSYPPGTTWVSSESQAPLAAQIRALVSQATAGVVVQP